MTYVTHPNPPANDDSQKIATTAWVKNITDELEASVSGGMFPKIQHASLSNRELHAPAGGTWWCYAKLSSTTYNNAYAGGALILEGNITSICMCIKIA